MRWLNANRQIAIPAAAVSASTITKTGTTTEPSIIARSSPAIGAASKALTPARHHDCRQLPAIAGWYSPSQGACSAQAAANGTNVVSHRGLAIPSP